MKVTKPLVLVKLAQLGKVAVGDRYCDDLGRFEVVFVRVSRAEFSHLANHLVGIEIGNESLHNFLHII